MKDHWKKVFIWSSVGSLAFGTTVSLIWKSRKAAVRPLVYRKIPLDCQKISLWTERFEIEHNDTKYTAYETYVLQTTSFKVWNILNLSRRNIGDEGAPIYHTTFTRYREIDEQGREEIDIQDRFYGIVAVLDPSAKPHDLNHIARSAILQIRKCFVGGASNGVETGEIHLSRGRILNYRFEYGPDAAAS